MSYKKTLTRNEAFKAMIDGHKIRNKEWSIEEAFGHFKDTKFLYNNKNEEQEMFRAMSFQDGYEIYTEKKTEKITWYRVFFHRKGHGFTACTAISLFKSKLQFLLCENKKEDDFHWIKLEEVMTHEYEVNE